NHRMLNSGEHLPEMFVDLWKTISKGKIWSGDIKNKTKDGGHYWVNATIIPFLNTKGKPYKYVSIRTDITRNKKIEASLLASKEKLEHYVTELDSSRSVLERQAMELVVVAEREAFLNQQLKYEVDVKNTFFSIISHDLKSPFTSLLGMTHVMAQSADMFTHEKMVEYARDVNEAGERVFELLQNLLEWSRLQMDGATVEPQTLSLGEQAQESFDILKPVAVEKGITLSNTISDSTAYADRDMVQTVIRNLVANSLKFTPSGGTIEVSAANGGNSVQLTVSDSGVGMTAEQAKHVFALDQKTSTIGTNGERGTGLGLPLCKDMIERNGGRIWVETAPGKGAQFHFTLPTGN
ncbi:MAG: PAS domain-containing sensor histidine kinase, partial [Magnetovibrio sp.]|nr:PAS domain-containing sensor histidine kinase [Magnetovibrio sp.]